MTAKQTFGLMAFATAQHDSCHYGVHSRFSLGPGASLQDVSSLTAPAAVGLWTGSVGQRKRKEKQSSSSRIRTRKKEKTPLSNPRGRYRGRCPSPRSRGFHRHEQRMSEGPEAESFVFPIVGRDAMENTMASGRADGALGSDRVVLGRMASYCCCCSETSACKPGRNCRQSPVRRHATCRARMTDEVCRTFLGSHGTRKDTRGTGTLPPSAHPACHATQHNQSPATRSSQCR